MLSETCQPDDAVRLYREALAVQPDLVEAHYNFGLVLDELGHHEEAAKARQKACELAAELFDKEIQTRY